MRKGKIDIKKKEVMKLDERKEDFIKLRGVVTEGVVKEKKRSRYKLNSSGKEYAIVSTGRQAIKDYLFVQKGQHMIIEGKQNISKKRILSTKSKIILREK